MAVTKNGSASLQDSAHALVTDSVALVPSTAKTVTGQAKSTAVRPRLSITVTSILALSRPAGLSCSRPDVDRQRARRHDMGGWRTSQDLL